MKLPSLLTQFLYKHKKLSLPGIGVFVLDPGVVIPSEHSKDTHIPASGIEFRPSSSHQVDDELIEYIKTHTGKMKSLAQADLESFLTLGTELLNIGKPFYLDGIGTLTKSRDGQFEFSPGEYSVVQSDDTAPQKKERISRVQPVQETDGGEGTSYSAGNRRPLILLAVLGGLALASWGGYLVYKRNSSPTSTPQETVQTSDSTAIRADSVRRMAVIDSTAAAQRRVAAQVNVDSGTYKYIILQTHNKDRALRRYNQLLSFDLKVKMETADSTFFKVYFRFPARNKDTVRIKDSLYKYYAHPVIIER